jgi:hypothetical protein
LLFLVTDADQLFLSLRLDAKLLDQAAPSLLVCLPG